MTETGYLSRLAVGNHGIGIWRDHDARHVQGPDKNDDEIKGEKIEIHPDIGVTFRRHPSSDYGASADQSTVRQGAAE